MGCSNVEAEAKTPAPDVPAAQHTAARTSCAGTFLGGIHHENDTYTRFPSTAVNLMGEAKKQPK